MSEIVTDLLTAGKIMLLCQSCADNFPEGCGHFKADTLRVASDGRWLCESCFDDETDLRWLDAPKIVLPAPPATAGKEG